MRTAKLIFQQTLLVMFLMNCANVLSEFISLIKTGEVYQLNGYFPISMMIVAFLTSLPTLILRSEKETTRAKFALRLVAHFITVYAVVMLGGLLFSWYDSFGGFVSLSVSVVIIYVLVWVLSHMLFKHEVNRINEVLADLHDEE